MASNIFGSDGGSAVPGGNVAKPLVIALLALLASRYFGGKNADQSASPSPAPVPKIPQANPADASPGDILDGLGGLVKQFQQKGLGNVIDSWVNRGQNQDISSGQVSDALGPDIVDQLARRTGLSREEVLTQLAKVLPGVVDQMTPDGRLPTPRELQRLMS